MQVRLRTIISCAAIGGVFWCLYFAIGAQLAEHNLLFNDVFFHSDVRRVLDDMTLFHWRHSRTNIHPLFVLFTNPLGSVLSLWTGSPVTIAVLLNSFVGGLGIALAGSFLVSAGIPLRRAIILSVILGCSAGHLFFGSVPETYSFSALSIVLLFSAALKHPGSLRYFVPLGVLSFGILLTNLATAAIAFGSSLAPASFVRRNLWRTTEFAALVVALAIALALVQKLVWQETTLFFDPAAYAGESRFVKVPDARRKGSEREFLLLRHVFAFDWFAPQLHSASTRKREIEVRFEVDSLADLGASGRAGVALWFALLLASGYLFISRRLYTQPVSLGLFLGILFNLALHSLYGDDLFLYACNTCFLVIAWAALCTSEARLSTWQNRAVDLGLLMLAAMQIANNAQFVSSLVSLTHT
ncbi:MAG: hypothetical protein QOE70_4097 [Chthoniobacter sp.]|nr:hypothetical protein [Chthoniobacter sp.]